MRFVDPVLVAGWVATLGWVAWLGASLARAWVAGDWPRSARHRMGNVSKSATGSVPSTRRSPHGLSITAAQL